MVVGFGSPKATFMVLLILIAVSLENNISPQVKKSMFCQTAETKEYVDKIRATAEKFEPINRWFKTQVLGVGRAYHSRSSKDKPFSKVIPVCVLSDKLSVPEIGVDQYDFPHRIALVKNFDDKNILCSGIFIDEWWILTSAHCLEKIRYQSAEVIAHTFVRYSQGVRAFVPTAYGGVLGEYDIGLLKITPPHYRINPPCAPVKEKVVSDLGSDCVVFRWLAQQTRMSTRLVHYSLRHMKVNTVRMTERQIFIAKEGVKNVLEEHDGPMVCQIDGKVKVVGITSHGHHNQYIAVTRVSSYLNWIASTIEENAWQP